MTFEMMLEEYGKTLKPSELRCVIQRCYGLTFQEMADINKRSRERCLQLTERGYKRMRIYCKREGIL